MPDIFISYSSHDRLQALSLAEKLRAAGYDPWIDQHQIHGANRWGKEIVQAITGSKLVAILISSSSLSSENVIKELNLAAERKKHLLPITLERIELTEEFAYHLTGLQRVAIENTDSILKALEELKIRTGSGTDFSPSGNLPRRTEVRPTDSKDIRLAVLPFDDLSKEHDNEWFADGMLDELITTLGALEHMKVPSRTDVMYYKKHHPKAQEIASDLNVRYLVGGSVRKAGEKIRITASLTDAFANQQIWTSNYDGNFDDIFDLQERVSKEITATLQLRLTPEDKKKIEEKPTENAEAYELCLKGLAYNRRITKSDYQKALVFFEKAIQLDPNFTEVYLAIANTCVAYYREFSRNNRWLVKAEENLFSAESISGETSQTLWMRGEIAWQREDLKSAELALKQAIQVDPKHELPYNILGNIYIKSGRVSDAVISFKNALRLKEDKEYYYNLMVALSVLGDKEELFNIAIKALPIIRKYIQHNSDDTFWRVVYGYTLLWTGNTIQSLKEAEALIDYVDLDGLTQYNLGALFDELGQPERNLELFRRAIQSGYRDIDSFKGYSFTTGNDAHRDLLNDIIGELEKMIELEK